MEDELKDIKRKKMSSWDVMSSILKPSIKPLPEEIETINSFFFARYLASNKHSVPIAGVINRYYNMPVKAQFQLAQDFSDIINLPSKVKFINYRHPKISKDLELVYNCLEKKYKISRKTAEDYLDVMIKSEQGQKELEKIVNDYDRSNEGVA